MIGISMEKQPPMPGNLGRLQLAQPPVVEVACGVQFEGLAEWRTAHYGQFWSRLQGGYSETQDHPPLARSSLDPRPVFEPRFSLWRKEVRLIYVYGGTPANRSYIYSGHGPDHGVDGVVNGGRLAQHLRWALSEF